MGRPAADLLQSLHEGRGAKRLSRNEGIDYPFYSFGVSFARHADMLQSLHEGDGVITFTLKIENGVRCLRATDTANMPEWLHEAGRVTYGTFLDKGNVADFWQALHDGRRARQSVPEAA